MENYLRNTDLNEFMLIIANNVSTSARTRRSGDIHWSPTIKSVRIDWIELIGEDRTPIECSRTLTFFQPYEDGTYGKYAHNQLVKNLNTIYRNDIYRHTTYNDHDKFWSAVERAYKEGVKNNATFVIL